MLKSALLLFLPILIIAGMLGGLWLMVAWKRWPSTQPQATETPPAIARRLVLAALCWNTGVTLLAFSLGAGPDGFNLGSLLALVILVTPSALAFGPLSSKVLIQFRRRCGGYIVGMCVISVLTGFSVGALYVWSTALILPAGWLAWRAEGASGRGADHRSELLIESAKGPSSPLPSLGDAP